MANYTHITQKLIHIYPLLSSIIINLQISFIFCGVCYKKKLLTTDTECYNDVIHFSHAKWRAGHACNTLKGELFVEFSVDESNDESQSKRRLLYGLKKNGRYYFPDEPVYKEITFDNEKKGRFESRNILVSLKDDTSKSKQYLFSMSTYISLTEMIDIENEQHYAFVTNEFLSQITSSKRIFSLEFSLFEIGNNNTYIVAYIEWEDGEGTKERSESVTVQKFQINSFSNSTNSYTILARDRFSAYSCRVVSAFRLDLSQVIAVLYIHTDGNKYYVRFYNDDLENKRSDDFALENSGIDASYSGVGVYVKGIYVKDDYAAFIYYKNKDQSNSLTFNLRKYNEGNVSFGEKKFSHDFTGYYLNPCAMNSNSFQKLEDNRLVFLTVKNDYKTLYMLLFDFYNDLSGMKIREYQFEYNGKNFGKDIAAYMFNGYILLSATFDSDVFSIMMIFGFGNGTDHEIDISIYLADTGYYNEENNLYKYLISTMKIDNNIFDYEKVEKIKLVKICDELLLYKGKYNIDMESETLPINELFDDNISLLQNRNIPKLENANYTLEYQFLVKEPNFAVFDNTSYNTDNSHLNDINPSQYYQPKTLEGRTNILSFKLCHKFCIDCLEFGLSDNDQRCKTCKEINTYDYLTSVNRFTGNCVPKGKMYDVENKKLKDCDTVEYKYYYNLTRNKEKYCFKFDYTCPPEYHFLNTSTNECINYSPPTSIITTQTTKITDTPTTKITDTPTTKITDIQTIQTTYIPSNRIIENNNQNISGLIEAFIQNSSLSSMVVYDGKSDKILQITSNKFEDPNDVNNYDEGIPLINLTNCESILKDIYEINKTLSLIIIKYLNSDNYLEYKLFNPITYEELDLSYCDNTTNEVYIPYKLDDIEESIYDNLINQGYDPLNLNDIFYKEICTPYTSENGTDVLLDDREEFIYNSLINMTICPKGCTYQELYFNKKYIRCECGNNYTDLVTLDLENLSGNNIGNSFLSTLKSTNWKVMICYNLVFNFKIFCHNYGSILILIFFIIYIFFIIFYCIRKISPLKLIVSKMLFNEQNIEDKKQEDINYYVTQNDSKNNNPPKKAKKNVNDNNDININGLKNNDLKNKEINNLNINTEDNEFIVSPKFARRKSKKNTTKAFKRTNRRMSTHLPANENNKNNINTNNKIDEKKKNDKADIKKRKNLDNFELNNLDYEEACVFDKRSFCTIYWSVLKREHLALVTFLSWKDYNLFYIKIEKFLILFCVDMTMNGLFFVHETMHRKYTSGEDFTFIQKLPQILFTLIVSHILEVILCFFSMTDVHIYQIKELDYKDKKNGEKIVDILNCIQIKLTIFFIFTFLLFLFFWYFISAFCAVYQNTQKIFLRDTMISFLSSLIDPFFIYGLTTILRRISLSNICKNNCCCGCVFKISDIIPIF